MPFTQSVWIDPDVALLQIVVVTENRSPGCRPRHRGGNFGDVVAEQAPGDAAHCIAYLSAGKQSRPSCFGSCCQFVAMVSEDWHVGDAIVMTPMQKPARPIRVPVYARLLTSLTLRSSSRVITRHQIQVVHYSRQVPHGRSTIYTTQPHHPRGMRCPQGVVLVEVGTSCTAMIELNCVRRLDPRSTPAPSTAGYSSPAAAHGAARLAGVFEVHRPGRRACGRARRRRRVHDEHAGSRTG